MRSEIRRHRAIGTAYLYMRDNLILILLPMRIPMRKYTYSTPAVVFKRTPTNTNIVLFNNIISRAIIIVVAPAAVFFWKRWVNRRVALLIRFPPHAALDHSSRSFNLSSSASQPRRIYYVYTVYTIYTTVQNKRVQNFLITRRSNIGRVSDATLQFFDNTIIIQMSSAQW